jgi:hypothetical protein
MQFYFWDYIAMYFATVCPLFRPERKLAGKIYSKSVYNVSQWNLKRCPLLTTFLDIQVNIIYTIYCSTFGTILPCTLLLYAHCLVQTRNDKYLKGPLSLLTGIFPKITFSLLQYYLKGN